MATNETICKFNQFGFCKFLSNCRKHHINENCQETVCENRNCLKRHPKNCKYFDLYKRCKFGVYCAFAHREDPLVKDIKALKLNYAILAEDLNDKRNEVDDLKVKVEVLENIVIEVMNRVENITTPTKKGTRKRRRVKQTPSPPQVHKPDGVGAVEPNEPVEEDLDGNSVKSQTEWEQEESENEISVEEILKMYESG